MEEQESTACENENEILQPILTTDRLELRPFSMDDCERVHVICQAKEIAANTRRIPHPYPEGAAEQWIKQLGGFWSTGKAAVFAICLRDEGNLIGAIGLELNEADENAEMGYWIDKPFWGAGYATEASQAMIRFGFETLGLYRIFAHYMTRNPGSGRVMEKAGMKREGLLRGHNKKWGVFEDVVIYGILKSELAQ